VGAAMKRPPSLKNARVGAAHPLKILGGRRPLSISALVLLLLIYVFYSIYKKIIYLIVKKLLSIDHYKYTLNTI